MTEIVLSLEKLRGECEEEVKRINGTLSLDTAVKWQVSYKIQILQARLKEKYRRAC